jgi:GNAT superfamily N-acetyltransferase
VSGAESTADGVDGFVEHPDPLVVRRGVRGDFDAIARLIEEVDRVRFDRTETEWAAIRERLRSILDSEGTVTFVAERGGTLVGELLGVPRRSGVLGIGVSVAEGSRRRGVATALFETAIDWARRTGLGELELDVQEANERARRLYEKLGFVDTGARRHGERGPVLTMVRRV